MWKTFYVVPCRPRQSCSNLDARVVLVAFAACNALRQWQLQEWQCLERIEQYAILATAAALLQQNAEREGSKPDPGPPAAWCKNMLQQQSETLRQMEAALQEAHLALGSERKKHQEALRALDDATLQLSTSAAARRVYPTGSALSGIAKWYCTSEDSAKDCTVEDCTISIFPTSAAEYNGENLPPVTRLPLPYALGMMAKNQDERISDRRVRLTRQICLLLFGALSTAIFSGLAATR